MQTCPQRIKNQIFDEVLLFYGIAIRRNEGSSSRGFSHLDLAFLIHREPIAAGRRRLESTTVR